MLIADPNLWKTSVNILSVKNSNFIFKMSAWGLRLNHLKDSELITILKSKSKGNKFCLEETLKIINNLYL